MRIVLGFLILLVSSITAFGDVGGMMLGVGTNVSTATTTVTPICQAASTTAATTTIACTSTIAVSAGETIVLTSGSGNSRTISSVSDGTANSYTAFGGGSTNVSQAGAYILNPVAVSSSSTFTVTWSGTAGSHWIQVWKLNITATTETHGAASAASGTAASCTTSGSASASAGIVGGVLSNSVTVVSDDAAAPWATPGDFNSSVNTLTFDAQHGVTTGSGTVNYANTVGNAAWACTVQAFN